MCLEFNDNVKAFYEGVIIINNDYIDLKEIDILVFRKISKFTVLRFKIIPFKEYDNKVYVFICNKDKEYINEIKFIYKKEIVEVEKEEGVVSNTINLLYLGESKDADEEIIIKAIEKNASDIHFQPNSNSIMVKYRIDGVLRNRYILTKDEYLTIISKLKIMANLDITEKRRPQDGKITFIVKEVKYDLRISIVPTIFGEKIVIRVLYGNVLNYSLKSLRITDKQRGKLNNIIALNTGLVIVNGPTGSGKTTTLYTVLNEINNDEINISTLEDPVEVIISGISQMSLNDKMNIGFATGLRSLLRQDPDTIMVGEIRDEETAKMGVRASLTGHKVYTTIHCKTGRDVYFRLEDMGVKGYLIRDSLVGIISQRLIRTLCSNCKKKGENIIFKGKKLLLYESNGCGECNYTGYKGRSIIAAVHHIDRNTRNEIINICNNINLLSNDEMIDNLDELIEAGEITYKDYFNFLEAEEIDFIYEDKIKL